MARIVKRHFPRQALALNALTTNRDALPTLIGGPLTALFSDAYVSRQLTDPSAREVLGYLVSCALDSTQVLKTPWGKLPGQAGLRSRWQGAG
jgi:Asp/Glu/hydantoin racemase